MCEETARLMRHESLDQFYPEKYLPKNLFEKIKKAKAWEDEDGFWWGWDRLYGGIDTDGLVKISVADLYHGQGYHTVRSWIPDKLVFVDKHIG